MALKPAPRLCASAAKCSSAAIFASAYCGRIYVLSLVAYAHSASLHQLGLLRREELYETRRKAVTVGVCTDALMKCFAASRSTE